MMKVLYIFVILLMNKAESLCFFSYQVSNSTSCGWTNETRSDNSNELYLVLNHTEGHSNDDVQVINSSEQIISQFPTNIFKKFKNLQEIKFYMCSMEEINKPLFNCDKLTSLYLGVNKLSYLDKGILQNCTNLITVNLSYNQITQIHPQAFEGLNKLINLVLIYNKMTDFDSTFLKDKEEMRILYFTDNSLQKLPNDLCSTLPNELIYLIFARNKITELQTNPGSFIHCGHLIEFHLYSNNLTKIKNGMFEGLKALIALELHENQIVSIENNAFADLENLESLTLNNNQLMILNSKLFLSTPKIITMKVNNNPLQAISQDFLKDLPNLKKLNLLNSSCIDKDFTESTIQFDECLAKIINCQFINGICELDNLKIDNSDSDKRIFVDQVEKEFTVTHLIAKKNTFMSFIPLEIFDAFPDVKILNFTGVGLEDLRNLKECANCSLFEKLIFDNNNLNYFVIPLWHFFPKLVELSFEYNNFTNFQFSSDSVKRLNLANNHISEFYFATGFGMNVEYLDLSSNKIQMNFNWFEKFESLSTLNLNNRLDEASDNTLKNAFKMTPKLKKLFISNRKIKTIQKFEFNGLIEILDLSNNFINDFVNFDEISGLENLKELNLSFNSFENFNIKNIKTLEILDLSYNEIKKLDKLTFENQDQIRELYLDGNLIRILYSNSFIGLINLEILSISNNILKVIETNTFSALLNLKNINLDNNYLQTLSVDEFGGNLPESLKFISLNSNSLRGISKFLLESLPSNANISLEDNPCTKPENNGNCIEEFEIHCEYIYNYGFYMCIINEARVVGHNYPFKVIGEHSGSSSNKDVKILRAQASSLFKFIPAIFFEEFTNLITINFNGRGLEYLNDFFNCNDLKNIRVENNRLLTLSKKMFEKCIQLESINLESNFLYSFGDGIVSKLNNLKYFNFGNNELTRITKDFFTYNQNLELLKFHNNFIIELSENIFMTLKNLKILSIRGNTIEILHSNLLILLNDLEEFEMQSLNLFQAIPDDFFSNSFKLRKLLMNKNQIYSINEKLLKQQKNLELLDLSYCNISKIEKNSFESLSNLQTLHLQGNELKEIDEILSANMTNLTELSLQYNKIKIFKRENFKILLKLEILQINHNEISKIETEAFSNLKKMKTLNFSSNEISIIDEQTFANNSELIDLNLDSNQIHILEGKIFKNLKKIEILKINFNKIQSIDKGVFRNLESLKELSLHDNKIDKMHPQMFENSTNLKVLDLSMNQLTSINAEIFNSNHKNLLELNFANNLIEYIETQAFQHLTGLLLINLQNNFLKTLTTSMFIDQTLTFHRAMFEINISHNLVNNISSDFFNFISVVTFDAFNNTCLNNNYRNLNSLSNIDEFKNCTAKILECRSFNISNNDCEINGFKVTDGEEKFAFEVKVDGISAHDVNTVRFISSNISFIPPILFDTFQNLHVLQAQNVFLKGLQKIENCTNLKVLNLDLNKNLELGASNLMNCVNLKTLSINTINLNELNVLALHGLMSLEELFMEDSNTVNLNLNSNTLKTLHMTRNNLKIDENIFKNLLKLEKLFIDVSNNSFDKMSLYNLKQLKTLTISKRKITNSNFPSFHHENNLEILISNENEVEKLNEEILKNLTNLIELEMMDNLINEIEVTAFRNSLNLKKINLESKQSGRITNLYSGTFNDLINLEILQLSGHQISTISSTIFENLQNLKILILKSNKITKIDDQAFATLKNLEYLYLSENNYLNHLSSNAFINFHKIETLNLKNCQLKIIPSSIIKLKTLKHLDISQNQLSWLLFNPSFEQLQFFDFSSNNITAINPKFFYENPNTDVPVSSYSLNQCKSRDKCFSEFNNLHLCSIEKDKMFEFSCKIDKLANNQQSYSRSQVKYLHNKNKLLNHQVYEIFELYENVLKVELWNSAIVDINGINTCSELKHFDLRMNEIENLNENSLNECTKLEILILVKNRIPFIDEKSLWNLKSLKLLDLSQNLIVNLKDEVFKENMSLEKLFLNHNDISTLNNNFFANLNKLKVLKLNNNSFKQLTDKEVFKNLKSLLELHINHNQISKMNEEIFNALIKLKYLNIEHNQLTEIDLSKISLKNLDYFDVSSNQITIFRGNFENLPRLKTFIAEKNICIDRNFGYNENLNAVLLHCIDKTKTEL